MNSAVVYYTASKIISMAWHKFEQKLFIQHHNFALGFAMKIGTAATFSITLVSNLSSEKLSSSASVIMATTTLATCFEGVIPHELFS